MSVGSNRNTKLIDCLASPEDYVKLLASEYKAQVKQLDNPDDPEQLREEFTKEINWFNDQMTTAVKVVKDKSIKAVAKTAVKEVSDIVGVFLFCCFLTDCHLTIGAKMVSALWHGDLGMVNQYRA